MKFQLLAIGLVVLLLVFGGWYVFQSHAPVTDAVACTADAMQCPDGSWVGRSGPQCEFVCPDASSTSTSGSTSGSGSGSILPYKSGIRGTVMAGPTCPVERNPPDPACADKPLQTLVAIFRTSDMTHAFVLTKSSASGTFEASLPPGDYVVGAGESNLPRCEQTSTSVDPNAYTQVVVECDTGIR